jgi:hypothetical protein
MQEHSPAQAVGPLSSPQKPSMTVAQVRSPSLSFPFSHPELAPRCPTRGFEFFCITGVKLTVCDCLQDGLPSTRYEHHTSDSFRLCRNVSYSACMNHSRSGSHSVLKFQVLMVADINGRLCRRCRMLLMRFPISRSSFYLAQRCGASGVKDISGMCSMMAPRLLDSATA